MQPAGNNLPVARTLLSVASDEGRDVRPTNDCCVNEMRTDQVRQQQATGAGCLLAILSVITTIGVCLVLGGSWASWVFWILPSEERSGVALPRVDVVTFPKVSARLGVVIFGLVILPGLAVFWLGQKVLAACGIPVWKSTKQLEDEQKA